MSTGYYIEQLRPGMTATYERTISGDDITAFAEVSGDHNPVHMDEAFAAGTVFKTRIAHGMLTASLLSTVLATHLPGPGAIYLSQTLKFRAPVRIGDHVTAAVEVTSVDLDRRRAHLDCACRVDGKVVVSGEAVVMVPATPAP